MTVTCLSLLWLTWAKLWSWAERDKGDCTRPLHPLVMNLVFKWQAWGRGLPSPTSHTSVSFMNELFGKIPQGRLTVEGQLPRPPTPTALAAPDMWGQWKERRGGAPRTLTSRWLVRTSGPGTMSSTMFSMACGARGEPWETLGPGVVPKCLPVDCVDRISARLRFVSRRRCR